MNRRSLLGVVMAGMAQAVEATTGEAPARLVESPLSTGHLIDTAAGLGLVLLLLIGLAWLVKRYVRVPGINKGDIQIVGGVSLGPRERAVLVWVDGTRLLLGVAPGRVQMLHVLGPGRAPADAGPRGPGAEGDTFSRHLDQLRGESK
jgi:flagellar protein FliO/FliZ